MQVKLPQFIAIAAALFAAPLAAQVQTEVPPVVASAKPVAVERIKIHGTALEGNLEGDAVDRDVLIFLTRIASRITCCRSSASSCVLTPPASS